MGLAKDGLLPPGFSVVGFARRPKTNEEFRADMLAAVREHGRPDTAQMFAEYQPGIFYHQGDFADAAAYPRLKTLLADIDKKRGTRGNRLFYLATPPSAYSEILENLKAARLSTEADGRFARVIVEKPFGHDRKSAVALNEQVRSAFREQQV